jgi:DNA-binding NarL/FixJ family response regulator
VGFLLKHSTPDELPGAVGVVAAGDALLAPSVTRRLVEDFARAQPVVLAEETVKTHVGDVLTKLDLRDRAQVVVYAYEAGVVTPGPRH